jgi:hypothetical protein
MSTPPTNQLSYMARKAICGSLESGDYITALESAQSILSWKACQANPEFLAQVVSIITFCGPQADKQRRERIRVEEQQRHERELEIAKKVEAKAKAELLREQTIATFGPLAEKYGVSREDVLEGCEPSFIVLVLQELEETGKLQDAHVRWLLDNRFYLIVANYLYAEFLNHGDAWNLTKAGRYFRQSGYPNAIVERVSDDIVYCIQDNRARSAVLTNRGGAKRDLSDLEGAKNDGFEAVNVSPQSFHPHNLLGATFYQMGQPTLGDQHFEKAEALGATPKQQEYEIKSALKMSTPEAREAVVMHLLAKDPIKYAWVSQYRGLS